MTDLVKQWGPWVLGLFLFLTAGFYFQRASEAMGRADTLREQRDQEAQARASLQEAMEELSRRAQAQNDSLEAERSRNDSIQAVAAQASSELQEMATEAGENLHASLDSLEQSVREPLVPVVLTIRDQVTELEDVHSRQLAVKDNQISSLESLNEELETTLAVRTEQLVMFRDSVVPSLELERDLAVQEADALRDAINPSFFSQLWSDLPKYGAALGAGIIAGVTIIG